MNPNDDIVVVVLVVVVDTVHWIMKPCHDTIGMEVTITSCSILLLHLLQ